MGKFYLIYLKFLKNREFLKMAGTMTYMENNKGPMVTDVEWLQDGFLFEEYRDLP